MKSLSIFSFLVFMVFYQPVFAQERTEKHGRIQADFSDLSNIEIKNSNTSKVVRSEKGGYFKIPVFVNDTLVFISDNFIEKRYVVRANDMKTRVLLISLQANTNVLKELVIDKTFNVHTSAFEPKKKYIGLEKDLFTANSGGLISQFVNLLSGRTKMLELAVEYQKENNLAEKMINAMSESYFTDELKIPKESIGGFGYYMLNDVDILQAVEKNNTFQLKFLLPIKANLYLENLKSIQQ